MRLLLLLLLGTACAALPAATFTVTNLADTGAGSLRDAITLAEASAGADDIVFAGSLTLPGTITLQTALPDITEDLTITGPASNDLTVARNTASAAFRIFTITGGTVEISHLWLGDGRVVSTAPNTAQGGCIRNDGTLTLLDCLIFDCSANGGDATTGDAGDASGGAIYSSGDLTLDGVAIVNCAALAGDTADAAGFCGGSLGGGVVGILSLTVLRSQFTDCVAQAGINTGLPTETNTAYGGGLVGVSAVVIRDSDFGNCSALASNGPSDNGCGVFVAGAATLDMARSSIHGGQGAGLGLEATAVLENCTISGNSGDLVGGISITTSAPTTLRYCTVHDNDGADCGGVARYSGTVSVLGCIIAGNIGSDPDVFSIFTDQGFNLIGDETGSVGFTTSLLVGDSLNPIDANLGPIQSFGSTSGHIPLFGSFAIDQGGGASPIDDQRGANRLFFAPPDIGAVEFVPNLSPFFTPGPTVTVDNDGDEVTIAGWATNINPGASWEAGQTLTFTITGSTFSFREPPEIDPDTGDLTFEPWEGDVGVFTFNVTLHDNGGTAGGGQDSSSTSQLVIELEDDGDNDEDFDDENFRCSTGSGASHAWLCLLGLLGLLGWRMRRD